MKKPRAGRWAGVILVLFLVSHAWLAWGYSPATSDANLYALYAFVINDAPRAGRTPYDHFELSRRESARSLGQGELRKDQVTLEYPPLALALLRLPIIFVPENGSGIPGLVKSDGPAWVSGFRTLYFLAYASLMLGMALWLRRKKIEWHVGLFTATVAGLALAYVLYDRLDLGMGFMLVVGLAALVAGRSRVALAALALAVSFKLVPIVLAPLFILGALPASTAAQGILRRASLRPALQATAIFVGALLAVALPFRLAWGPRVWDFLAYHGERGFQIESTWASLLLIAGHLGYPLKMVFEYGADGLTGPGLPLLAKISSAVNMVAVAVPYLFIFGAILRGSPDVRAPDDTNRSLAAARPQMFVWAALAVLACATAGAKVFSPQYLCAFLPCLVLVQRPSSLRAALPLATFVVASALTAAVFPWLWRHVVRPLMLGPDSPVRIPSLGVTLVMVARNAVWVVFCVLAVMQARQALQVVASPVHHAAPSPGKRHRRYSRA